MCSSTIIEDIQHDCCIDSVAMGYFYFDFNDRAKQQFKSFLCSLLTRLSYQCTTVPPPLARLYSQNYNGGQQPHEDSLISTLREMLRLFKRVYIIVDALDECSNSEERDQVLTFMEDVVCWKLGNTHLWVTSRREADIEACFKPLVSHRVELHSDFIDQDIQTYLHHQLKNDRRLRWVGEQSRNLVEENLKGHANGM